MDEGASPNRTNIFKKITDFMKNHQKMMMSQKKKLSPW